MAIGRVLWRGFACGVRGSGAGRMGIGIGMVPWEAASHLRRVVAGVRRLAAGRDVRPLSRMRRVGVSPLIPLTRKERQFLELDRRIRVESERLGDHPTPAVYQLMQERQALMTELFGLDVYRPRSHPRVALRQVHFFRDRARRIEGELLEGISRRDARRRLEQAEELLDFEEARLVSIIEPIVGRDSPRLGGLDDLLGSCRDKLETFKRRFLPVSS